MTAPTDQYNGSAAGEWKLTKIIIIGLISIIGRICLRVASGIYCNDIQDCKKYNAPAITIIMISGLPRLNQRKL